MGFERGYIVDPVADSIVFSDAIRPTGLFSRARGLIGRTRLREDQAMWFDNCKSVHMFGMHYAIDVVFVDKLSEVVRVAQAVKPFMGAGCLASDSVLEISAGQAQARQITSGIKLCFRSHD